VKVTRGMIWSVAAAVALGPIIAHFMCAGSRLSGMRFLVHSYLSQDPPNVEKALRTVDRTTSSLEKTVVVAAVCFVVYILCVCISWIGQARETRDKSLSR